jgi:hypothetical protein
MPDHDAALDDAIRENRRSSRGGYLRLGFPIGDQNQLGSPETVPTRTITFVIALLFVFLVRLGVRR